jgi:proteic killer suppression protein
VIKSFNNTKTKLLYITGKSSFLPATIIRVALRKLDYLNAAKNINDLRIPPGNRLEKLKGELEGYYSIRINVQYRIIFQFDQTNAYKVEITDYHK